MTQVPPYLADPLSHLLAPQTVADFCERAAAQLPLQIPTHTPDRFAEIFNWTAFDRLLATPAELPPGVRVIAGQMNYLFKKESCNRSQILAKLREGGALVLENVDTLDPDLGRWTDALSRQLAIRVAVNLYFSSAGFQAYPLHYDTHDFFILQIAGHKRWQIHSPTLAEASFQPNSEAARLAPVPPPTSPPLAEFVLGPGDVLYLPRGYWHQAMAEQSRSLHLTVGLYRPSGADLLTWLAQELTHSPSFRKALPWAPLTDWPMDAAQPNPWQEAITSWAEQVQSRITDPQLASAFFQAQIQSLPRRQPYHLPEQLIRTPAELADIQSFAVCQQPHYLVLQDGMLHLIYQQERLRFDRAAEPLLRYVLAQTQLSRTALLQRFPDLGWPAICAIFVPLVQDGFLVPLNLV